MQQYIYIYILVYDKNNNNNKIVKSAVGLGFMELHDAFENMLIGAEVVVVVSLVFCFHGFTLLLLISTDTTDGRDGRTMTTTQRPLKSRMLIKSKFKSKSNPFSFEKFHLIVSPLVIESAGVSFWGDLSSQPRLLLLHVILVVVHCFVVVLAGLLVVAVQRQAFQSSYVLLVAGN
jgi:hypothetical protein